MNDADFEAQKARVVAAVQRWVEILPLSEWEIRQEYFRGQIPGHSEHAIGTCTPSWKYMHAFLQWNLMIVSERSDEDLDKDVIHEISHCLNDMLVSYAMAVDSTCADQNLVELATTILERAISQAYRAGVQVGIDFERSQNCVQNDLNKPMEIRA